MRLARRITVLRVAYRDSRMPIAPAMSSEEKNAELPMRECVVVSAMTRTQSESRRIIFGLRIHSMVRRTNFFQLSAVRSERLAISSPMPTARLISRNPARWLRLA